LSIKSHSTEIKTRFQTPGKINSGVPERIASSAFSIAISSKKMSRPVVKSTAVIVGLAATAYLVSKSPVMPTKKQTVIWGINGQLNDMNSETGLVDHGREERALEARERAYG